MLECVPSAAAVAVDYNAVISAVTLAALLLCSEYGTRFLAVGSGCWLVFCISYCCVCVCAFHASNHCLHFIAGVAPLSGRCSLVLLSMSACGWVAVDVAKANFLRFCCYFFKTTLTLDFVFQLLVTLLLTN